MDNFRCTTIPWSQRRLETPRAIPFLTKTSTIKCLSSSGIPSQLKTTWITNWAVVTLLSWVESNLMSRIIEPDFQVRRAALKKMWSIVLKVIKISGRVNRLATSRRATVKGFKSIDAQVIHHRRKCLMIFRMTHSMKSLRRRLSISIAVSSILSRILIFTAKYAGIIIRHLRTLCWTRVSAMVRYATFTMSALNIGWSRRWSRRRNQISYRTPGNSLSARFVKNHIHMYSGQTVYHTGL